MDFGLKRKRAIVLAGTKGLGRAAAEALAAEGADIVVSSSHQGRCEDVAAALSDAHGVRAAGVAADMFDPRAMDALHARAVQTMGGVDVLFINHVGPALGLAQSVDTDVMEAQFQMMVASPVRLIMRVLPEMRARRWGRIVAVGGGGMVHALPNKVMDNTLRPAMVGYTKSLANEVAADGVTVNMILPGTFITERVHASTASNAALCGITVQEAMRRRIENIPAGRFGDLREFGAVVAFVCSEAASYVNGSVVRVDGSQTKSIV